MNYRKIYEDYHKVTLTPDIDIHHIDGDRNNNSIKNLVALTREEHIQIHLDQGDYGAANLLSKGKVDVSGERNPMHGVKPWNKGKKLHYEVWNKGVTGYKNNYPKGTTKRPQTKETIAKRSAAIKESYTDELRKLRSLQMKERWKKRKELKYEQKSIEE